MRLDAYMERLHDGIEKSYEIDVHASASYESQTQPLFVEDMTPCSLFRIPFRTQGYVQDKY